MCPILQSSDDTPSPTASLKGKLGGRAAKVKELDQAAEDSDNGVYIT